MQSLIKKTIKILLIVFLILASFISLYGFFSSCQTSQSDLLVVLGNKVYPDGTLSPVLKARVDRSFDAWQKGCASHILVSGGTGKEGFPEGTAMANYLIQKGVPETSISVDNKGINSYNNSFAYERFVNKRKLAKSNSSHVLLPRTSK